MNVLSATGQTGGRDTDERRQHGTRRRASTHRGRRWRQLQAEGGDAAQQRKADARRYSCALKRRRVHQRACMCTQYQYLYNTVTRRAPAAVSSHVSPIATVAWRARGSTQARADRGFDTPLLRRELRSSSIASAVGGEVVAVAVVVDLEVNHSRMNRRRQAIITRGPRTFSVLPEGFSRVGRRSLPASCV